MSTSTVTVTHYTTYRANRDVVCSRNKNNTDMLISKDKNILVVYASVMQTCNKHNQHLKKGTVINCNSKKKC